MIGDSFLEGMQVNESSLLTNYVRDSIQQCDAVDNQRIEVLNFGVSGYGTAQELLLLGEKVWKYSPDLVILLMSTNNDIADNSRIFRKKPIPYFVYQNGDLTLDNSFRNERSYVLASSKIVRLGTWIKNHLRIIQAISEIQVALKHRYRAWKDQKPEPPSQRDSPAADTPVAEVGIDSQIYRPPVANDWVDAWAVTEGLLTTMNDEVTNHRSKFVVVTGSNGVQVLPGVAERTAFARLLGVDDLFYPDPVLTGQILINGIDRGDFAGTLTQGGIDQTTFSLLAPLNPGDQIEIQAAANIPSAIELLNAGSGSNLEIIRYNEVPEAGRGGGDRLRKRGLVPARPPNSPMRRAAPWDALQLAAPRCCCCCCGGGVAAFAAEERVMM